MTNWVDKQCAPCEGGTQPMTEDEIGTHLKQVHGWAYVDGALERTFEFKNYYQTTAFVTAVVWIAHREDHHPDISFGYKQCVVRYHTHAIGGISDNDFICAAKVNALLGTES